MPGAVDSKMMMFCDVGMSHGDQLSSLITGNTNCKSLNLY